MVVVADDQAALPVRDQVLGPGVAAGRQRCPVPPPAHARAGHDCPMPSEVLDAIGLPRYPGEYRVQLGHRGRDRLGGTGQHRPQVQVGHRREVPVHGRLPGGVPEQLLDHEPRVAVELPEIAAFLLASARTSGPSAR